jgi:hypothetical protein
MLSARRREPFARRSDGSSHDGSKGMGKILCFLGLHKWQYKPLTYEQELKYYLEHSMIAATEIICERCPKRRIIEG